MRRRSHGAPEIGPTPVAGPGLGARGDGSGGTARGGRGRRSVPPPALRRREGCRTSCAGSDATRRRRTCPSRRLALAAADAVDRGRGDRAAAERELGERLLHAQGPGRRRLPPRLDPEADVRRAQARPRRGRADPRPRAPGALRGEGRVPAARALARAVRARRAPRRDRAAEADAGGRRSLRRRAQAAAPSLPAPDRARHRQRRRRAPRRADDDPDPLPARARPRRGDARAGPARRGRDRRGAAGGRESSPGST